MAGYACINCSQEVPLDSVVCVYCGTPIPDEAESARAVLVDTGIRQRLSQALGPKYQLRRLVGRGGFCDVYEAWDTHLERRLAIKLLRTDLPWGPGMATRFEREARALGTLNHLHIPPVHFVGDREGLSYFAMPFIEGRSLAEQLATSGPVEPRRMVEIMIPILDALGHAHRCGIIHRDVKPENIILETGTDRPLLMDFGVAKEVATRLGSSLPGVILGTPAYISPEQITGGTVDHRSDIYAVGGTLYHLLTGNTAFSGEHPGELIRQQLSAPIPPPDQVKPGIPAWLSSAVLCALEQRPEQRFQSAAAMAEALRAGLRSESVEAEWAEPSFMGRENQFPGVAGRLPAGQSPPWWGTSEDLPVQAERWAIQLRWVVATLLVSLIITWLLLVPMQLVLKNNMLVPISVRFPRGGGTVVGPGAEFRLGVGHQRNVVVQWELTPVADGGFRLGERMGGVLRVESFDVGELMSKRIERALDIWKLSDVALAPRVINRSSQAVTVRMLPVRSGDPSVHLAPGSELLLGYYRWAENVAVLVRNASGDSLILRPSIPEVNSENGEFRIQVTDSAFAPGSSHIR